jgi:hypothetical protein
LQTAAWSDSVQAWACMSDARGWVSSVCGTSTRLTTPSRHAPTDAARACVSGPTPTARMPACWCDSLCCRTHAKRACAAQCYAELASTVTERKMEERYRAGPGFKVAKGGQTGADRAVLDWAIAHGLRHGGWRPSGHTSEDGVVYITVERLRLRGNLTCSSL